MILKTLKLTTLEIRRKRGDLIEFYKILNGLERVEWKNEQMKTYQGNMDGPASNLRRKKVCFHREPANVCNIRENFFINRTILLWNDLSVEVKEVKSLNS